LYVVYCRTPLLDLIETVLHFQIWLVSIKLCVKRFISFLSIPDWQKMHWQSWHNFSLSFFSYSLSVYISFLRTLEYLVFLYFTLVYFLVHQIILFFCTLHYLVCLIWTLAQSIRLYFSVIYLHCTLCRTSSSFVHFFHFFLFSSWNRCIPYQVFSPEGFIQLCQRSTKGKALVRNSLFDKFGYFLSLQNNWRKINISNFFSSAMLETNHYN